MTPPMTTQPKVTGEVVERVEAFAHMVKLFGHQTIGAPGRFVSSDDLDALTALCRRVIEPGEDEIARLAKLIAAELGDDMDDALPDKSAWVKERGAGRSTGRFRDVNEPFSGDYLDAARAVLASLTQGEGD